MKETRKQLNNLIRDFYDESEAAQMARDIEEADAMMASMKTPAPRAEVIRQIRKQITGRTAWRHQKSMLLRSMLTAAAACILIGTGLILFQMITPSVQAVPPEMVKAFFSEQPVEKITSNLEEISDQLYTVDTSSGDNIWGEELDAIEEIEEMELLTDSDFWKG